MTFDIDEIIRNVEHYRHVIKDDPVETESGITSPVGGRPLRPLEDRFWEKVKKGPKCWKWLGARNSKGYGKLTITLAPGKYQKISAHRISYALHYGPFDKKLYVCHKCDTPICVRPDHLFVGTAKDNVDDMMKKGRRNPKPRNMKDPELIAFWRNKE